MCSLSLGSEGHGISNSYAPHLDKIWDALKRLSAEERVTPLNHLVVPIPGAVPDPSYLPTPWDSPSLRRDPERQLDFLVCDTVNTFSCSSPSSTEDLSNFHQEVSSLTETWPSSRSLGLVKHEMHS